MSKDNQVSTNMPVLSVEKTIRTLSRSYCTVIGKGLSPKILPSVMLWGPPGVGKSQAVRQIGKDIEAETGKQVVITDVRLLLFNPIDLRGIPTANADKTLAIWLKPSQTSATRYTSSFRDTAVSVIQLRTSIFAWVLPE